VSRKDQKENPKPEKADIIETTRGKYGMPITASIGTGWYKFMLYRCESIFSYDFLPYSLKKKRPAD